MFSNSLSEPKFSLEFSERKLLLCTADIFLIASGIIGSVGYWSYLADQTFEWEILSYHSLWTIAMGIGWLIWMFSNDLYDLRTAVQLKRTIQRIGLGCLVTSVIYLIYYFVTAAAPLSDQSFSFRFAPALAIVADRKSVV